MTGDEAILRRIRAADGSPGVRTTLAGTAVSVFDAHPGPALPGRPGDILRRSHGAVHEVQAVIAHAEGDVVGSDGVGRTVRDGEQFSRTGIDRRALESTRGDATATRLLARHAASFEELDPEAGAAEQ